jgi:hypothetical protein
MRGCQAVCIMHMDHMGSQARYVSCTMICIIWARRTDMQGRQAVCTVHMDHMGSQDAPCIWIIWVRRPDMSYVP